MKNVKNTTATGKKSEVSVTPSANNRKTAADNGAPGTTGNPITFDSGEPGDDSPAASKGTNSTKTAKPKVEKVAPTAEEVSAMAKANIESGIIAKGKTVQMGSSSAKYEILSVETVTRVRVRSEKGQEWYLTKDSDFARMHTVVDKPEAVAAVESLTPSNEVAPAENAPAATKKGGKKAEAKK